MSVVGNDTRVSSRVFCFSIPPLSPFKAHISVFLPTAETCFLNGVDFPNSLRVIFSTIFMLCLRGYKKDILLAW